MENRALTAQELNNEKEFFSPIHQRLRKELIETRQKLKEVQAALEASEKRNLQIMSSYNREEVARTVHAKIVSLPQHQQTEALKN